MMAAPMPIPPIAMPMPSPRCPRRHPVGHGAIEIRRATDSPTPSRKRTMTNAPTVPTNVANGRVATTAVNTVQSDHQTNAQANTTHAPQRSPRRPPGIWQSA